MTAAEEPVLVERAGAVLVVTLNRPHARNAIDAEVARRLGAAFEELDGDPSLAVGILTGAGGFFCAGMDLKAFLRGERPHVPGRGFAGIAQRPPETPLIAAVEGPALAGGFEIALACDLIVASREARFGLPEAKRGLVAAAGGLLRLPERIPASVATEMALTGDPISAADAERFGLVSRLTEPGGALAAAHELAVRIAANGPLAVRASKAVLARARDWSTAERFDRQAEIVGPVLASEDAREGAAAFAEKRAPRWQGR